MGATIESWTAEATELMLDVAKVGPGTRVLDIAAGAGGQSLAAAKRGASVVATDMPGPFSLANGAAEAALAEAGFVAIESHPVAAPLRLKSAAECTRFERESFGALHQMLSGCWSSARYADRN